MSKRRMGIILISLIFLVYGGVRFGVSSVLLAQDSGIIDMQDFHEPLVEIDTFLQSKNPSSLISLSTTGYLGYLWIMGALLLISAAGFFTGKKFGHYAMSSFLGLYVMLFVNFMTINPKIIHLIACALLFGLYLKLSQSPDENT